MADLPRAEPRELAVAVLNDEISCVAGGTLISSPDTKTALSYERHCGLNSHSQNSPAFSFCIVPNVSNGFFNHIAQIER